MKTLFLSIGHNWGKNPGSTVQDQGASANGTTEARVTKNIIDTIITKGIPGIKLIKVPEGLNLSQRTAWINKNLPGAVEPFALEFHLDAGPATAVGASVWYNDNNEYTKSEGVQFLQEYTRITGLSSRHVNSDTTDRLGQLGFVSDTKCAALLIELGFITNAKELGVVIQKGVEATIGSIVAMNK